MNTEIVPIEKILQNPSNPRIIKDDKFKKLVKSIQEFPQMLELRPIVVDANMVVLGGNMRLKACKAAGLKEVPIVIADNLTEEQQAEFIIKDNVGFGEWDWDLLANEWDEQLLQEWGLDLPFDNTPVLEAEEDDYEAPSEIKTDVVLGDLIEIGNHRLLCGDSSDSDLLQKVLNGNKIDLLLTDPPYGIDYGSQLVNGDEFSEKTNKHGWRNFGSPDWDKSRPSESHLTYLIQISNNQIIWGGNYFTDFLPPSMGWLIWDKGQRGFSLADGEMAWTSFNNALRIKEYARALANREEKNHPTQKPIEIIKWCFDYADRHSKSKNEITFDAFLGSGSTMVTAHQLNRKCYGMELDPKYCQVIVDRMHKLDPALEIKINGKPYDKY